MLCVAITTASTWLGSFIIARSTPYMITDLGYATYFVFGAFIVSMAVWAFFCIPETKGLTLEQMGKSKTSKKKHTACLLAWRIAGIPEAVLSARTAFPARLFPCPFCKCAQLTSSQTNSSPNPRPKLRGRKSAAGLCRLMPSAARPWILKRMLRCRCMRLALRTRMARSESP